MNRLIDLQTALDLLEKDINENGEPPESDYNIGINHARCVISTIPSARSEIIECKNCKNWTQSTGKIKGDGLGRCDFHDADLVSCNGFCYWAEMKNR